MATKPYLCQIDICKYLFKPFKLTTHELASFLPVYSQYHWIGLWDEGGQHDWVWITGELLTDGRSNSWWNGGQPDHPNGQVDCTEMYPAIHNSRWNDQGCSQQRRYICEYMFWVHWTIIVLVNTKYIMMHHLFVECFVAWPLQTAINNIGQQCNGPEFRYQ